MDKKFCNSKLGYHGSTIVFAILKPLIDDENSDKKSNENNNDTDPKNKNTNTNNQTIGANEKKSKDSKDPKEDRILNKNMRIEYETSMPKVNHNNVKVDDNDNTSNRMESKNDSENKDSNDTDDDNDLAYLIRIFWAGDSRGLLIRGKDMSNIKSKRYTFLTEDHTPSNPNERNRVFQANGMISCNRVDGQLAVTRAFGDVNFKDNPRLSFENQRVTSLCEYEEMMCKCGDNILLFCDGLVEPETWDNSKLVRTLKKYLLYFNNNSYNDDAVYSLAHVFDNVLHDGSQDNMSCILIQLKNGKNNNDDKIEKGGQIKSKITYLPGKFYDNQSDAKFTNAYFDDANKYGFEDCCELRKYAYCHDIEWLKKYYNGDDKNVLISRIESEIENIDKEKRGIQIKQINN